MSESENETYWPGYVDVLSNMVLALIFLVLVLALALSQYSAMAARQLAEEIVLSENTAKGKEAESANEAAQTNALELHSAAHATQTRPSTALTMGSQSDLSPAEGGDSAESASADAQLAQQAEMAAGGGATSGAELQDTAQDQTVAGAPTETPPRPMLPLVIRVTEDLPHRFTAEDGVRIEDADGDIVEVELSVLNGTLGVEPSEGVELTGAETGQLALRGPQDKIAEALGSLSYQGAPNYFGKDNLVLRARDGSGGETVSVADLMVAPVNDAPIGEEGLVKALTEQAFVFSLRDFPYSDVEDDRLSGIRLDRSVELGTLLLGTAEVDPGTVISADQIRGEEFVFVPPSDGGVTEPIRFLVTVIDAGGVENGGQDTAEAPSEIMIELISVAGRLQSTAENTVSELPERDPGEAPVRNVSSTSPGEEIQEMTELDVPAAGLTEETQGEGQDPDISTTASLATQDPTRPGAADDAGNVLDARIQPDVSADDEVKVITPSSLSTGPTGEIVVQFPDRVVALDQGSSEILAQQIRLLGEPSGLRLSLAVLSPFPNLTVERSVAMTRGISIWQNLIAAGVPADAMTIRIERELRSARLGEVRISRAPPMSTD
jgi:hypothetical protein